jgi:hypothetical protein
MAGSFSTFALARDPVKQLLQRFSYEFWFCAFGRKRHEARRELFQ